MADLFAGSVDRDRYARYVAQNWFIYAAIEGVAVRMADDPIARAFTWPELTRLPSVEADLAFLCGPDWRSSLVMEPATARYVTRIQDASAWSGGFVAHHYVRYMGDLSGGQAIARFIAERLGLPDAVRSLEFAAIPDLDAFKAEYRRALDEALWTPAERARVIGEVLAAYDLATGMLLEL